MEALKTQQSVVWSMVYLTDEFSIDTEAMRVQHRKAMGAKRTYADVVGVYAYAIDTDGNVSSMIYVTREELDIASKGSPRTWANYPEHCAKHRVLALLESAVAGKQKVA